MRYKLQESTESLSLHDWNSAYHLIRSAYKDSERLLSLLLNARTSISSVLECEHVSNTQ